MRAIDPAYQARLASAARLRADFAQDFGAREIRWSGYNLSRLLRLTGERPARVAEMRSVLDALGLAGISQRWIGMGGAFDHGVFWGRGGKPWALVGHPYPYGFGPDERALLADLARFPTLLVRVDDRPSYYGFGTHHVRVELAEVRRPFTPFPSTARTRAAARAARQAFAEAFDDTTPGDPE